MEHALVRINMMVELAITVRMAHSYFLPTFMEYLPAVDLVRRVATYCLHFFALFLLSSEIFPISRNQFDIRYHFIEFIEYLNRVLRYELYFIEKQ